MRRAAHIVVLAVVLAGLCACGHRGRVISENKLVRIYHDMFLADQWVRDHPDAREVADTTLLFDPIFRRYGYSFEDYDRSVQYYLDHTERYFKLLNRVEKQLRKEGDALQLEADRLAARDVELSKYRRGFSRKDFSTDSLRWAGVQTLWPVDTLPAVDTLAARADSLAQADTAKVTLMPELPTPTEARRSRRDKLIKMNETE
jgi:hypothetical protein